MMCPSLLCSTPANIVPRGSTSAAGVTGHGQNADINSQNGKGDTPLHKVINNCSVSSQKVVDIVRRLLEHGTNPNIRNRSH